MSGTNGIPGAAIEAPFYRGPASPCVPHHPPTPRPPSIVEVVEEMAEKLAGIDEHAQRNRLERVFLGDADDELPVSTIDGRPSVRIPVDAEVSAGGAGLLLNGTVAAALSGKADLVGGKVPSGQLPSYVDDVIEVADYAALPEEGEQGKIYVTVDDNTSYRWSGTQYVEIASPVEIVPPSTSASDAGKAADAKATGDALAGKADKVANATANNFAALDSNGNLKDSGKKPADFAAATHNHTASQITDLGSAATKNVGTTSGTVAAGDDSRLTDARTPTAHASTHATNGSDPIIPASIGALGNSGNQTLNGTLTVGTRASGSEIGTYSVAEGMGNTASGNCSHAEGWVNIASGNCSHAEGLNNTASSAYSHAEGNTTTASNTGAHAEGLRNTASGNCSHAEGMDNTASGAYSHAEGDGNTTQNWSEHAQGRFNKSHTVENSSFGNAGNTLSTIGFGSNAQNRKNAVETMQDGKTFIYGLGGYDGTNPTAAGVLDLASAIYSAVQQIAPAWVSGTSYAANALVSYNGFVYQNTSGATIQSATTPNTSGSGWTAKRVSELLALLAPLASPAFTGTPTAPTPTAGDNSTKVATTAFVQGALPYAMASVSSGDALADRTVNTKTVNAATYAPSFPAETSGKSCDFYLAITSDTAGTVSAPSGKTLNNAKGESANLDYEANKTTVLRFTQISANTYVVTGGANGGGSVDPATLNTKANSTALAPNWSNASASYQVSQYITYNGNAYECMAAYTTDAQSPTPDNDIYNDTVTPATGHWKLTDMTTPDATLDVTSQGSLRVVSAGGQTLWQQGYDLTTSEITPFGISLANEAVNKYDFAANATAEVSLTLPTPPTDKVGDFVLDVTNPALDTASFTQSAFDSAATYAVGDEVIYDSKIWRCVTAVSTAGAWTGSTNWEEAWPYFSIAGLSSTVEMVVPKGENLSEILSFAPGTRCELYFTLTSFAVNSRPTWKVVRQDVEVVA